MTIKSTLSLCLACTAALFAQTTGDTLKAQNPSAATLQEAQSTTQNPSMRMGPPPMYPDNRYYQGYPSQQPVMHTRPIAPKPPEKPEPRYFNGLGLALGISSSPYGITESGLSYRHWFEGGSGLQLTLFPYLQNDKEDKYANLSAGASYLKVLHPARRFNLYSFVSYSYNYKYESNSDWNSATRSYDDREDKVHQLGFGPGMEFHVKNLSLNMQIGAGAYYESQDVYGMCVNMEGAAYYAF